MAKKSHSPAQPNPAIRLSNLRSRLSSLFAAQIEPAQLVAELNRLTDGLKPASFLPMLVGAFAATSEAQHEYLNGPLVAWIRDQGLLATLHDLATKHAFKGADHYAAKFWLEASGMELPSEAALDLGELFIDAYEIASESQASITLFWYEDGRRRRVRVGAFLIDFEPPWEGALKDLAYNTFRDIRQAYDRFQQGQREGQAQHGRVTKYYATEQIWTALRQSYTQGIRLPSDFIAAAEDILPFVFALPVADEGLRLSEAEFETILTSGRDPESIRSEERLLGYQMRMADGSIVRIMRPPDDHG